MAFEDRDESVALTVLEHHPDYRVLRRLVPPSSYTVGGDYGTALHSGVIVDTETTGLEENAKIIEFALLPFEFDDEGNVHRVSPLVSMREDPGEPLSAEIRELTGLTDEDLSGQQFDDERVTRVLAGSDLVVAHSAEFDRPLTERRFPDFISKAWGCSRRDIPWPQFGVRSAALDYLLARVGKAFNEEHRAGADCYSLLHVLAQPLPVVYGTYLTKLLESVRTLTYRIQTNPPFDKKDVVKARGYRAKYNGSRFAYWWKDVRAADVASEEAWLREHADVYFGTRTVHPQISARERYSNRI